MGKNMVSIQIKENGSLLGEGQPYLLFAFQRALQLLIFVRKYLQGVPPIPGREIQASPPACSPSPPASCLAVGVGGGPGKPESHLHFLLSNSKLMP